MAPLQSDEPLTLTPDLSGKWLSLDADDAVREFVLAENAGGNTYGLSFVSSSSEKIKDYYLLSLVQVGSYIFFDTRFEKVPDKANTFTESELAVEPIHFIGRIEVDGDTLRLRVLNYVWLRDMASNGKLKLRYIEKHLGGDDFFILTAESEDLGEFVRQYAEDPQAFPSTLTFQRLPPDGDNSIDGKP